MGDVEGDAFVITMHNSLVHEEAEKDGVSLPYVESKVLRKALADSIAEVRAEKVGQTLLHVEAHY